MRSGAGRLNQTTVILDAGKWRPAWALAAALLCSTAAMSAAASPPTFYRDVLPLLEARCQTCHRPGGIAPIPLLTYVETRPWAGSWNISPPDLVLQMPAPVALPAKGDVQYTSEIVPTRFTRDQWVLMSQIHPSSPEHVHHAVVYIRL